MHAVGALAHRAITHIPDEAQELFINLPHLDLGHNALTAVPAWFSCLQPLGVLVLAHNQLSMIPEGVGSLDGLTKLDLSHNSLTALPEIIKWTLLQDFNVCNNLLTKLPDMHLLASLTELSIQSNRLTSFPCSVGELKSLVRLTAQENQVRFVFLSVLWCLY